MVYHRNAGTDGIYPQDNATMTRASILHRAPLLALFLYPGISLYAHIYPVDNSVDNLLIYPVGYLCDILKLPIF
jgi:hypothetical protein